MSNEVDFGVNVTKETDKRSDSSDVETEKKGVTNYGFSEKEENRTDSNLVNWQKIEEESAQHHSKLDLVDLSPRIIRNIRTRNGLTEEQYSEFFPPLGEEYDVLRLSKRRKRRLRCCMLLLCGLLLSTGVTVATLISSGSHFVSSILCDLFHCSWGH